jgi:hypothetical protein
MACLPGLPDLGGLLTEEETPTPPPPTEEAPAPPPPAEETPLPAPSPGGQEWPFEMDVEALDSLDSYAHTMHFEGLSTAAGDVEHTSLDIQGQRQTSPTQVEQLSFFSVSDGESTSTEFIYIEEENKMWIREEAGEWEELPIMDPAMLTVFDAFSMFSWWDMLFTGDPQDVVYVGQEMLNGVQTNHYRAEETANWAFATGCTWASAQDDIWVAVDGGYPVVREFDASGECEGESGEVSFFMEISQINEPVSISPPT